MLLRKAVITLAVALYCMIMEIKTAIAPTVQEQRYPLFYIPVVIEKIEGNTKEAKKLVGDFDLYLNDIYVPCYWFTNDAEMQPIVDRFNSAGAYKGDNYIYIADHVNQAFSRLYLVKKGDILNIKDATGVKYYECVTITRHVNSYTYEYWKEAERLNCEYVLQTCDPHYPQVMFCFFKEYRKEK